MAVERAQLRDIQQTIQDLTRALLHAAQGDSNRGARDLHRNFWSMNPHRFSGTTNPDEAEHWLKETERIFHVMQCTDEDKLLLTTFHLERDACAWWKSVEATRADGQFTWNEFKEEFNSKKAAKFTALKQRNLTVVEYEAQFSRLA
ncbi:hypothetical protein Taro_036655 [Colocasia esculenta]|uniref:Retrotransposon gag domain-containing protein n=1 Tax=Colocasia esculenta TaxID=4460 RepID=A0A843W901_COLES|nr:hypothetical protein [Colocasia esculenta]